MNGAIPVIPHPLHMYRATLAFILKLHGSVFHVRRKHENQHFITYIYESAALLSQIIGSFVSEYTLPINPWTALWPSSWTQQGCCAEDWSLPGYQKTWTSPQISHCSAACIAPGMSKSDIPVRFGVCSVPRFWGLSALYRIFIFIWQLSFVTPRSACGLSAKRATLIWWMSRQEVARNRCQVK